MLCCGYTLTDFPISIRFTSLALWQSNDCPCASKATLMNMDKYFMWIHYERLHNHNKAKHNKTVCIFLGIYCICMWMTSPWPPLYANSHNLIWTPKHLQTTKYIIDKNIINHAGLYYIIKILWHKVINTMVLLAYALNNTNWLNPLNNEVIHWHLYQLRFW